jgi:GT2 family glycosyltransferase
MAFGRCCFGSVPTNASGPLSMFAVRFMKISFHSSEERKVLRSTVRLTVIIVTWNSAGFIAGCLKSLKEFCSVSAEVLVVDNASVDGTAKLIQQEFPWVKLIENKTNLGFARANNIGIRAASGEYLCLINPDVVVLPGCLHDMLYFMEENRSVGLMGPAMIGSDGTVQSSGMRFPSLWNCFCDAFALYRAFPRSAAFGGQPMHDCSWDRVQDVDILTGWFWLVRRPALDQVGPLDERFFMYGEDVDWCTRFRQAGWRLVYYPLAKAIHYGGGSSEKDPIRFYIEMQRANLQYWQKHKRGFTQAAFLGVVAIHHLLRIAGYGLVYLASRTRSLEAAHKVRRSVACLRWLFTLTPRTETR